MNKYNLIDILTKEVEFEENSYKFNGIQIPMIQRDYAQGREGEGEIRKRFLKAIFNALENNTQLELDFVYGAKKSIDDNELFIPLDGQQRLTTLYLLNWYIGNRELDDDKSQELRNSLANFSYATRATSDTFCERLSKTTISFITSPSEEIENASWFFDSFKLDSTVQSMLVMLDAIHIAYGDERKDLYSNLNQIRFYILPLDGFDLTDELYIKMNARGKQLTYFENFKADVIKWIKDPNNRNEKCNLIENSNIEIATECNNCDKDCFHKKDIDNNRITPYYLFISQKLDNEWTDFLWNITKNYDETKKDDNDNFIYPDGKLVDPLFMRFFNRYFCNLCIISSHETPENIEQSNIFKYFYGNQGDDSKIIYNSFDNFLTLSTYRTIQNIEKTFNTIVEKQEIIKNSISPSWDNKDWMLYDEKITQNVNRK